MAYLQRSYSTRRRAWFVQSRPTFSVGSVHMTRLTSFHLNWVRCDWSQPRQLGRFTMHTQSCHGDPQIWPIQKHLVQMKWGQMRWLIWTLLNDGDNYVAPIQAVRLRTILWWDYVCFSVRPQHNSETTWLNFTKFSVHFACSDHPLTALRYVVHFRFCGWRHVFTRWPHGASCNDVM